MEQIQTRSHEDKQAEAHELRRAAKQGIDVSNADPRRTSIEAVVTANKIYRAQGRQAVNLVQSAL